jgi:hypothetical protein
MTALAGVAAILPATGQAKKPPRLITAHAVQSVGCVPGPANTVRAQVKLWMRVVSGGGGGGGGGFSPNPSPTLPVPSAG